MPIEKETVTKSHAQLLDLALHHNFAYLCENQPVDSGARWALYVACRYGEDGTGKYDYQELKNMNTFVHMLVKFFFHCDNTAAFENEAQMPPGYVAKFLPRLAGLFSDLINPVVKGELDFINLKVFPSTFSEEELKDLMEYYRKQMAYGRAKRKIESGNYDNCIL